MTEQAVIWRETAISVAINMAISAAFFVAMFGTRGPVPLEQLGPDCVPQAFMVALMGSLVPGLLACRRFAAGRPAMIAARAFVVAVVAAVLGGGAMWLLYGAAPASTAAYRPTFLAKVAFGGLVAAIVTPFSIRHVLNCRGSRA